MKTSVLTLLFVGLFTGVAFAAEQLPVRTQDNIDRNVIVRDDISSVSFEECAQAVCQIARAQGNGFREPLPEIYVVATNLTTYGADMVRQLSCVASVEDSVIVEPAGER